MGKGDHPAGAGQGLEPKLLVGGSVTRTDLVLLHAPSVYDFREKAMLPGPVSDVVPSTQIFEMYPIGFLTLLTYLEHQGFRVRIINVALRMLRSRRFDVEKLIRSLRPLAFGIDLHWLVHAQGSLELARLVKKHHPDIPVIFGGLSASYFHRELIAYPQVDYVLRGDSTEEPLRRLMVAIRERREPLDVPNLTWKCGGQVIVHDLAWVPPDLNGPSFDYRQIIRSCGRHLDVLGHIPFLNWLRYPIVAGLTCRGCVHDCVTCGGSASAFRAICGRERPAFRDAERLAEDLATIAPYIRAPSITLGDPLQAGRAYAEAFIDALGRKGLRNHVALEFFVPPDRPFLERVAAALPRYNIQISPESHDEEVRRAFGRGYGNERLEQFVADALELGCRRLDLFFMIGLPKQTSQSVRDTVAYCEYLLEHYGRRWPGRLDLFISPLAPFLDPGSKAFEDPARHGYRLFHRSLEEHRQALLAPSWKYTLNYETVWMSRDELVDSVYEAALALNALKRRYGLLRARDAQEIDRRITAEWQITHELDAVMQMPDADARERRAHEVLRDYRWMGHATLCRKEEMNWPTRLVRFSPLRFIRAAWSKG